MTKNLLQIKAEEVLRDYQFGRFRDLKTQLHKTNQLYEIPRRLAILCKDENMPYPENVWLSYPSLTRDFHVMESDYKRFLEWIVQNDRGNKVIAPDVFDSHPNTLRNLTMPKENICDLVREIIDMMPYGFHDRLIDYMKKHADVSEFEKLVPVYLADMINLREYPNPDEIWHELSRLGKEHGDLIHDILIKRIPKFPPEVDEKRIDVIETTPNVLNGMYDILLRYCIEKGYVK